jgi:hypothetical protein
MRRLQQPMFVSWPVGARSRQPLFESPCLLGVPVFGFICVLSTVSFAGTVWLRMMECMVLCSIVCVECSRRTGTQHLLQLGQL